MLALKQCYVSLSVNQVNLKNVGKMDQCGITTKHFAYLFLGWTVLKIIKSTCLVKLSNVEYNPLIAEKTFMKSLAYG